MLALSERGHRQDSQHKGGCRGEPPEPQPIGSDQGAKDDSRESNAERRCAPAEDADHRLRLQAQRVSDEQRGQIDQHRQRRIHLQHIGIEPLAGEELVARDQQPGHVRDRRQHADCQGRRRQGRGQRPPRHGACQGRSAKSPDLRGGYGAQELGSRRLGMAVKLDLTA